MTREEYWFEEAWFRDFRSRWQRDLARARRFVYWQPEQEEVNYPTDGVLTRFPHKRL